MGLLDLGAAIGQGTSGFLSAYYNEKERQDRKAQEAQEKAMKDKMYKLQLTQSGLQETPEGEFSRTQEYLDKQQRLEDEKNRDFQLRSREEDRRAKESEFDRSYKNRQLGLQEKELLLKNDYQAGLINIQQAQNKIDEMYKKGFLTQKDKELALEENKQKLLQLIQSQKNKTSADDYKKLPFEIQKQIGSLAEKQANITAINNEIKATLQQLNDPNIPEDQKITIGRSLLKTLNSTQGADAISSEEAARLGSYLEYKIANFKQPGSFIGRDLDKFIQQVALTSQKLDSTSQKNKQYIEQLYGKQPSGLLQDAQATSPQEKVIGGVRYRKVQGGWEEVQ